MAEITAAEAMTRFGITKNQLKSLVPPSSRGKVDEELLAKELERKRERGKTAASVVKSELKSSDPYLRSHTNVIKVIEGTPKLAGCFMYDKFADQTIVTRNPEPPPGIPGPVFERCPRPVCDQDSSVVLYWCEAAGFSPSPATVDRVLKDYAASKGVHPVREYLEGLTWDGTPRLTGWLTYYLGVKFDTYSAMVGRYWLISAVARVFEPGCQADHVLILEGKQGIGKSSATRILSVDRKWHFDGAINLASKETPMLLQGKWIVEFQELGAMRRAEGERIKEFFTQHVDKYVKKYSNNETVFPRQCVFVATVNHDQYLQDDTGNRRFWPVVATQVKFQDMERDVDQLWAEAYVAYSEGLTCPDCELPWRCDKHRWWPTADEQLNWFSIEQDKRVPDDLWHVAISRWMTAFNRSIRSTGTSEHAGKRWPTTTEVLTGALQIAIQDQAKIHEVRAARVLRALGYEPIRRRLEDTTGPDVRLYVWEPTQMTQSITEMAEVAENERQHDGNASGQRFGQAGAAQGGGDAGHGGQTGVLAGQGGQGKDPVGQGHSVWQAGGHADESGQG